MDRIKSKEDGSSDIGQGQPCSFRISCRREGTWKPKGRQSQNEALHREMASAMLRHLVIKSHRAIIKGLCPE